MLKLQFDKKWVKDSGFVHFDFNNVDQIPAVIRNTFDYIVIDPPFITSEVCVFSLLLFMYLFT